MSNHQVYVVNCQIKSFPISGRAVVWLCGQARPLQVGLLKNIATNTSTSSTTSTTSTTSTASNTVYDCLLGEVEEILISVGSAQKRENLFVLKQRINNIGTKYWTTPLQSTPHHHLNRPTARLSSNLDQHPRSEIHTVVCGVWSMYYQVIVL